MEPGIVTLPQIKFQYSALEDPLNPVGWQAGRKPGRRTCRVALRRGRFQLNERSGLSLQLRLDALGRQRDGLPDKVDSLITIAGGVQNAVNKIYLQGVDAGGNRTWTMITPSHIPGQPFAYINTDNSLENLDKGVRFGDVNGDGLPDKIDCYYHPNENPNSTMNVYYGSNDPASVGWSDSPNYVTQDMAVKGLPFSFFWYEPKAPAWHSLQRGTLLADVNGDGYVDKIDSEDGGMFGAVQRVFLGNGTGFDSASPVWVPPSDAMFVQIVHYFTGPSGQQVEHFDAVDLGVRLFDLNGDGLPDLVKYCPEYGGDTDPERPGSTQVPAGLRPAPSMMVPTSASPSQCLVSTPIRASFGKPRPGVSWQWT